MIEMKTMFGAGLMAAASEAMKIGMLRLWGSGSVGLCMDLRLIMKERAGPMVLLDFGMCVLLFHAMFFIFLF